MKVTPLRHRCAFVTWFFCAFLESSFAWAQAESFQTTVHGNVPASMTSNATATAIHSVIDVDEQAPFSPMSSMLHRAPGVHLRDGGLNGSESLSIRGAEGHQIAIYLDDVRLTAPGGGSIDLALFSSHTLSRVEVYRSGGDPRYTALGGALVLRTSSLRMTSRTELHGGYGSWNAIETGVKHRGSFSTTTRYVISGTYRQNDGNHSFLDENNALRERLNNDLHAGELLFKADRPIGSRWQIGVLANSALVGRGAPGLSQRPSLTARQLDGRGLVSLSVKRVRLLNDALSFSSTVYHRLDHFRFDETTPPLVRSRATQFGWGATMQTEIALPGWNTHEAQVSGGVELRGELFRSDDLEATRDIETARVTLEPWIASRSQWWSRRIVWDATLQLSWANRFDVQWLPRVGIVFTPLKKLRLEGVLAISRRYRHPSFRELYLRTDGFGGNAALKPEDALQGDWGVRWRHTRYRVEITYFRRWTKNTILFAPVSSFLVRPDNYTNIATHGIEAAFSSELPYGVSLSASYTGLSSLFSDPPMRIVGQPRHQVYARLAWDGVAALRAPKRFWARIGAALRLWIAIKVQDDMVLSRFNSTNEEGRTLLSVGGSYRWRFFDLAAEGSNLLNKRDALDAIGFPLAPARFFLLGTVTF